jgi:hypothetical protein
MKSFFCQRKAKDRSSPLAIAVIASQLKSGQSRCQPVVNGLSISRARLGECSPCPRRKTSRNYGASVPATLFNFRSYRCAALGAGFRLERG